MGLTSCKKEVNDTKVILTKEVFDRTVPGVIKSKKDSSFNVYYLQDKISVEVTSDIYNKYEEGDTIMLNIYNVYKVDTDEFVNKVYKVKEE